MSLLRLQETEKLSGLWYNVKQHAGISLGSLSVFLAIWTFEEDHPWSVTKMMLCFMLCLVALGLHEIRPYQVLPITFKPRDLSNNKR